MKLRAVLYDCPPDYIDQVGGNISDHVPNVSISGLLIDDQFQFDLLTANPSISLIHSRYELVSVFCVCVCVPWSNKFDHDRKNDLTDVELG